MTSVPPSSETARAIAAASLPAQVSIIIPTFNECANIAPLLERLGAAMRGQSWEVVFVDDDSTDGTLDRLRAAAGADPRVRLIHRIGRRGLSSAVVEGIQSTSAPLVAVMDADLQHDEKVLPLMIEQFADTSLDLVVGSRYAEGGDVGAWAQSRQWISRIAVGLSRFVINARLTDPMSGFFMIRRDAFQRSLRGLSGQGYKILLDIVASAPRPLNIREIPFTFGVREHGASKLDTLVTWEYLTLLLDKSIGRYVPARFVMFSMVGGAGVIVHMAVLSTLFRGAEFRFEIAQAAATLIAMTFNYVVNNKLTYRDRRRRGFVGNVRGLASFYAIGAVGALANVGVASFVFAQDFSWALAGLAGILVGAVWNYGVSSIFTWRAK